MRPFDRPQNHFWMAVVCLQTLVAFNLLASTEAAEVGAPSWTKSATSAVTVEAEPDQFELDSESATETITAPNPDETKDLIQSDPTEFTAPTPTATTEGGKYIASTERILTPKGEVALDYKGSDGGAVKLPEELNDGELEGGDHHTSWDYSNQASWFGEYPQCSSENRRQSPIDIVTNNVTFRPEMMMEFVDYDQEVEFELKNTHHSVSLTPICSLSTPSLKVNWVGPQEELFELQEIHFHWGDGENKGSEHEINDKRAAAEMHMVHYRKGLDKSQIGHVENSVLVIGVLIESDAVEHNKLESLVVKSQKVNGTNLEYKDENPQNLINLLPENHHSYYTYNGSLTTPPCYEVVTWVIMSEPVFMCQEKLIELANLEADKPGVGRSKINSNHRNIQPLLDRPVYASFNATDTGTYELSSHFQKKQIDAHGMLQMSALRKYWAQVNRLNVSVKRAFKSLEKARKKLWASWTHQKRKSHTSNNKTRPRTSP